MHAPLRTYLGMQIRTPATFDCGDSLVLVGLHIRTECIHCYLVSIQLQGSIQFFQGYIHEEGMMGSRN